MAYSSFPAVRFRLFFRNPVAMLCSSTMDASFATRALACSEVAWARSVA